METIYMLQVNREVLSANLLEYLKDNSDYIDRDEREFITSVWYLTNTLLEEENDEPELVKEVHALIKKLESEITDSDFDGLQGYDYIQFI